MNKIVLENDEIKSFNLDEAIKIETHLKQVLFEINTINLEIKKNTDLYLEIDLKMMSKIQFNFNLLNDVVLNLYIITTGVGGKIKYGYNLNLNSCINICKYNNTEEIKEMVIANLNNENAEINYLFKTIARKKECYDYVINHNAKNTISNIKNNGVNLSGDINIQISSTVFKDSINCKANQINRIINLTKNKCEIKPILYIDTDLIDANHSAFIGDFDNEELFYLQTLGISRKKARMLLIKGFLLSGIENDVILTKISESINEYWR